MSFRRRLGLFFVLIVAIPLVAIALLVVDVTRESEAGKADAQLSTALTTALSVYERAVEEARAEATALLADPGVEDALRSGDPGAIRRSLARAGRRRDIEHLAIVPPAGPEIQALGSGAALARAEVTTDVEGASYRLSASTLGPTEYAEEVAGLTGLDALVTSGDEALASSGQVPDAELPGPGESRNLEAGGEPARAAAGELPEPQPTRVVLLVPREEGGFFGSRPLTLAAMGAFLLVALAFIVFVSRTLQGQIEAMLAAARRIGSGDFSERLPVTGRDEMAGLAEEFNRMSDRLEEQIQQLRRQRTELDRSLARIGDAVASGLDLEALLGIVADAALGACGAQHCVVELDDGTRIERPGPLADPLRDVAGASRDRVLQDEAKVVTRREQGFALGAPLTREGRVVGTLVAARGAPDFTEDEREMFVFLLDRASASIENVSAHRRVSAQAVTDELTGLANNRAFRETIDREAARAKRFGHELSLVICDLDDFKQVNDKYGHLQGDEALRSFARILESEPRAIDVPARYGGEEFVVALPETGAEGAEELAERIRARVEAEEIPSVDGGKPLRVTASFGVATMPVAATSVRDLFEAADAALYEAKRKGKNRVVTAPASERARR